MTITIPKPLALALAVVFGGGLLWLIAEELPDLYRYSKFEGM